jgi:hypothetical protein
MRPQVGKQQSERVEGVDQLSTETGSMAAFRARLTQDELIITAGEREFVIDRDTESLSPAWCLATCQLAGRALCKLPSA